MLKVLIAEDELIIADLLEETLIRNGYEVCGIAGTVDEAVALVESCKPDLAILDVRLARGGRGPEIARKIDQQTLGILYATGNDPKQSTLRRCDGIASISKPYRNEDVLLALEIIYDIMKDGTTTRKLPANICLLPDGAAQPAHVSPR
jgi:DNA-binding response OmpR family regulator